MFNIPADLIKRFHADCKRAGIERIDDRGKRVDLHALRKTYGTRLAMAGVPLTVAQRSNASLGSEVTSNLYTDVRVLDLHGAVESMAPIGQSRSKVVAKVVLILPACRVNLESTDVNQDGEKEVNRAMRRKSLPAHEKTPLFTGVLSKLGI